MQKEIDSGAGFNRCRDLFGIAHATWKRAIACGDIWIDTQGRPYADARKRFDWAEIQAYYDAGNSIRKCQLRFGFSMNSWHKARLKGKVHARRARLLTIDELAVKRSNRGGIKSRLIRNGTLPYVCAICGISDWQGKPLTLQIDHINGKRLDYRIENLRLLCPNCHSQTETFGGRNLVALRRGPG
jgi:5-methylcytosine-specific restriction endonuclease McrA